MQAGTGKGVAEMSCWLINISFNSIRTFSKIVSNMTNFHILKPHGNSQTSQFKFQYFFFFQHFERFPGLQNKFLKCFSDVFIA